MPKEIVVFRSGSAVWLEIDGTALPVDWIDEVQVNVGAGAEEDSVMVLLTADRVHLESHPVPAPFSEEADDGQEAQAQGQQAGQGQGDRLGDDQQGRPGIQDGAGSRR
jgi:hypothetical protein